MTQHDRHYDIVETLHNYLDFPTTIDVLQACRLCMTISIPLVAPIEHTTLQHKKQEENIRRSGTYEPYNGERGYAVGTNECTTQ